jgi:hypothetical protein
MNPKEGDTGAERSITKEGLLPPPMEVGGLIMIEEEAEVEVGEVIMRLEDVAMVMVMDMGMGMGPELNQIRIMLIKASPDTAMDTGQNMGTAVIEEEGGVGGGGGEEEEEVEGGEDHIDDIDDNTLATTFCT